jgi:hypothetical protein
MCLLSEDDLVGILWRFPSFLIPLHPHISPEIGRISLCQFHLPILVWRWFTSSDRHLIRSAALAIGWAGILIGIGAGYLR